MMMISRRIFLDATPVDPATKAEGRPPPETLAVHLPAPGTARNAKPGFEKEEGLPW